MTRPIPTLVWSAILAATACGDSGTEGASTTTTTSATDSLGSTTVGQVWTSGVDTDELEPACSVMADDCPGNNKCTVVQSAANEIEYVCVPILGNDQPGELCEKVPDEPGRDSCAAGSVCVGDDAGEDRCVAFCGPDEACAEDTTCVRTHPSEPLGEGLPLCLRECNPLQAPCEDGWACHEDPGAKRWYCAPRLGGQYGDYASPCDPLQLGLCAPGFACLPSYVVSSPECSDPITPEVGCCAKLCDLAAGLACPGEGEQCQPFYPEAPPPGLANLGVCALPGTD